MIKLFIKILLDWYSQAKVDTVDDGGWLNLGCKKRVLVGQSEIWRQRLVCGRIN